MIVILSRDRRLDRASCQNSVGAAKIEPAINLSRPEAIFSLPSNRLSLPQSDPHILMVESTEHGPHFDAPVALNGPSNGCILP
jgi:hypothetical protein